MTDTIEDLGPPPYRTGDSARTNRSVPELTVADAELVERCRKACMGYSRADSASMIRAVLREARYAELVAALQEIARRDLGMSHIVFRAHAQEIADAALKAAGEA
jgi:hypothetical protein